MDRDSCQKVAAVQSTAQTTVQMPYAGPVIGIGAAPFGHDGVQGGEIGIEVRGGADEDVAAASAGDRIGAKAADQEIASGAGPQGVVACITFQHVVGPA